MAAETLVRMMHEFLDAELMLEQRRTELGNISRQYEAFDRAKQRLIVAMGTARAYSARWSMVTEAHAYLAATAAFEQVRRFPVDGTETAGPARRLERAQQRLLKSLNDHAHASADGVSEPTLRVRRVLVGVDGSISSEWALEAAGRLAADLGATVKMIHVQTFDANEDPRLLPMASEPEGGPLPGDLLLRDYQLRLPKDIESFIEHPSCDPAVEIVGAARRWGADYIVVGACGRGRLSRFVLGSVAEAVVRLAACPVITVGHAPEGGLSDDAGLIETIEPMVLAAP